MTRSIDKRWWWLAILGVATLWAYWPVLGEIADRWANNPQYSHGYLVPAFAAFLLWYRRDRLLGQSVEPSWWGLGPLGLGLGLHLLGAYLYFDWFSAASLLPLLAGIALVLGGARAFAWSWPAIAFLAFMLPLPFRVEHALSYPLQRMATIASTYVLQTIGLPAIAEGNVIYLEEMQVGIVEACNGLGMLVTFFALSTAVAILMQGRLTDRIVVVASAIPIALMSNVIRIVITCIAGIVFGAEVADKIFHDWAGYIMMPIALGLLGLELQLLKWLLVEEEEEIPSFQLTPQAATTQVKPSLKTAEQEHAVSKV